MGAAQFFAVRLKALLDEKGMSQYALAKLAGLSKQAVSNLILGNREPSWETVQRLAAALEVDCSAFADPSIETASPDTLQGRGRPRKTVEGADDSQGVETAQPAPAEPAPRGRPRKATAEDATAKKKRKTSN